MIEMRTIGITLRPEIGHVGVQRMAIHQERDRNWAFGMMGRLSNVDTYMVGRCEVEKSAGRFLSWNIAMISGIRVNFAVAERVDEEREINWVYGMMQRLSSL
jgi:hypothetical protein